MKVGRLLGFVVIFDILAALILYPHIDVFSGGYLVVSTALAVLQAVVGRRLSKSDEIQRLFYAKDIDKAWDRWVAFLGLAELAVFFEYAHWRPVPQLVQPALQSGGLLLCVAGTIWLAWVDSYLVEEFPAHFRRGALMTSGPYRLFRHPRYVGLFATRLALPLVFGSVIGWALAIAWFVLIRRRAHLEEQYLRSKFGQVYAEYAAHSIGML
jgi:protein-S-isoprenylcysteine O-methyltransferase Ste14